MLRVCGAWCHVWPSLYAFIPDPSCSLTGMTSYRTWCASCLHLLSYVHRFGGGSKLSLAPTRTHFGMPKRPRTRESWHPRDVLQIFTTRYSATMRLQRTSLRAVPAGKNELRHPFRFGSLYQRGVYVRLETVCLIVDGTPSCGNNPRYVYVRPRAGFCAHEPFQFIVQAR